MTPRRFPFFYRPRSASIRGAGILPVNGPRTSQSASLLLTLLLLFIPRAQAHDSRDSITEATLNRDRQRLEITLSVHVTDLELALSRSLDRPITLDQEAAATLDPLIMEYLVKVFHIKSGQDKPLPLAWVGKEPEGNAAHPILLLHFEVPLPEAAASLTLHQGIFCELHDDQINLVEFRDGDRKLTLGFSPQHGARTIPL